MRFCGFLGDFMIAVWLALNIKGARIRNEHAYNDQLLCCIRDTVDLPKTDILVQ